MRWDCIHNSSRRQYWFDNTWRCMYSFVLLMMGGETAWNMSEQFIEINRSRKRCILLVVIWKYTCDARAYGRQIGTNVTILIFFSETIITFTIKFRYHKYILYKVEVKFFLFLKFFFIVRNCEFRIYSQEAISKCAGGWRRREGVVIHRRDSDEPPLGR
jgi:hypothetical protein